MTDKTHRLTDDEMKQFIINGYIIVQTDLPPSFHEDIRRQTEALFDGPGDPRNAILAEVPALHQVFEHPTVSGVLTSILGQNYLMQPHRHCHLNQPGSQAQNWHQDGTPRQFQGWNHPWRRHHRVRSVMAFYYPHDVTDDMGPTGILPSTQYYNARMNPDPELGLPVCGKAGTVTLVHYELWHRATANRSNQRRYMMKFLFNRTAEPQSPTWNAQPDIDTQPLPSNPVAPYQHQATWDSLWNWYTGETENRLKPEPDSKETIPQLLATLRDAPEPERLNATYALGEMGDSAVEPLLEILRDADEPLRLKAACGLSVVGAPAMPALVKALTDDDDWWVRASVADTLGDIGIPAREAVPALIDALRDESDWVRRNAVTALGTLGNTHQDTVPALIGALRDPHPFVRINTVTALVKLGKSAQNGDISEAMPALTATLNDEHERVRYYAADALEQIGTNIAYLPKSR
jgi:hypothetical protein